VRNARASTAWPTTAGQTTASEIEHSRDDEGDDSYIPRVGLMFLGVSLLPPPIYLVR
jgi:hypothetical protein